LPQLGSATNLANGGAGRDDDGGERGDESIALGLRLGLELKVKARRVQLRSKQETTEKRDEFGKLALKQLPNTSCVEAS